MPPRRRRRSTQPRYLGLNLAWAPRNTSGGAVMEAGEDGTVKLISTTSLRSHEDILAWIARNRGRSGAVLAVNAPIIVENTSGPRPCDTLLVEHFAQYQIDDYQANIVNASHPRTIGRALMRMGFDPDPSAEGDRVVETYNRPAQILLWNLERPIRLKSGPVGARKDAVSRFRDMLYEKLTDATPELDDTTALTRLMRADLPSSNGSRVGELEDRLEATLAAYTAAYLALRGPQDCAFLGDLETGYILLPTSRYVTRAEPAEDDEEIVYVDQDGNEIDPSELEEDEVVYVDEDGNEIAPEDLPDELTGEVGADDEGEENVVYVDEDGNEIDPSELEEEDVVYVDEDGNEIDPSELEEDEVVYVDEDGNEIAPEDLPDELTGEAGDEGEENVVYVDEDGNEIDPSELEEEGVVYVDEDGNEIDPSELEEEDVVYVDEDGNEIDPSELDDEDEG